MTLVAALRDRARALGFLACGVTDLEPNRQGAALDRWLARGFGGTMRYLHRQAAKRKRPAGIVPGAVRAVVVLENYFEADRPAPAGPAVRIARYARGRDYHLELIDRLEELAAFLRGRGATLTRCYADGGPVPERELASRAGLGWIGKNAMLIRPGAGSFVLIGSILTDLALPVDQPLDTDHCGSCTRCLDACPTEAIVEPRVVDATRCISYLTIELKSAVPDDLVPRLDGWAFGCDVCNDVCPWNERFAEPTGRVAYHDRGAIGTDDPGFFDRMTEAEFEARYADSPLERPGLTRMRRNFANAFRSLDS